MATPEDIKGQALGLLDTMHDLGVAEGKASRDAEVAGLEQQITELEGELAAVDPFRSFYQLEAPNSLSTDACAVIQKALDTHGEVTLGPGDWSGNANGLQVVSGQHLHLHDDTVNLWRNYSSSSATRSAFIRNRDFTKPIDGLAFTGPGNIAARQGMKGCVFGLKVDNLVNDGWGTTYWTKGRHSQTVGNNHRYTNPKPWRCDPNDTSGSGGLRYGGGDGFHAIGLDIWSGDDVIQLVPAGAANDPLLNYADITNAIYEGCKGKSYSARGMVVGLQTDGSVTMTVSIDGWQFIDCHLFGGGTGVNVANHAPSTGAIRNGKFIRSSIDQSEAGDTGQPGDVFVLRESGAGPVENIDLSGLTLLNGRSSRKPFATKGAIGTVVPPQAA